MKRMFAVLLVLLGTNPTLALERNVAGQSIELFAFDKSTNAPKTGDAANLTAYVSIDGDASPDALTDTGATEVDATKAPGVYRWDLTQAETNGANIFYSAVSSTSNVVVCPRFVLTAPPTFSTTLPGGGVLQCLAAHFGEYGLCGIGADQQWRTKPSGNQ